jgi:hypothetical protein
LKRISFDTQKESEGHFDNIYETMGRADTKNSAHKINI